MNRRGFFGMLAAAFCKPWRIKENLIEKRRRQWYNYYLNDRLTMEHFQNLEKTLMFGDYPFRVVHRVAPYHYGRSIPQELMEIQKLANAQKNAEIDAVCTRLYPQVKYEQKILPWDMDSGPGDEAGPEAGDSEA